MMLKLHLNLRPRPAFPFFNIESYTYLHLDIVCIVDDY